MLLLPGSVCLRAAGLAITDQPLSGLVPASTMCKFSFNVGPSDTRLHRTAYTDQNLQTLVALLSAAGPAQCYAVGVVQRVGKTLNGGMAIKGGIRHRDEVLCSQRGLGAYLVGRFTLGGEQFPWPTSAEWGDVYLFSGVTPVAAMSYQAHNSAWAKLYKDVSITVSGKVTHCPRLFCPRNAKENGAPDAVGVGGGLGVGVCFGVCCRFCCSMMHGAAATSSVVTV